jgi:hypothetical protein
LLRNPDVPRLALLPYWVGGLLLVLGAVPNPVSPSLILTSGAAAGFGAMAGLLAVPRIAAVETLPETGAPVLGFSWSWTLAAILVGGVFVFVIGPGVAL